MKILVLNGPNLNLLGERDRNIYGGESLEGIRNKVAEAHPDVETMWFQSNHEGELVDYIQKAREQGYDGIVANWGAYSHTSVAIRDALEMVSLPKVEVHLSNIHARETFRERSLTGRVMNGIITGFGPESYILGVEAVKLTMNKK